MSPVSWRSSFLAVAFTTLSLLCSVGCESDVVAPEMDGADGASDAADIDTPDASSSDAALDTAGPLDVAGDVADSADTAREDVGEHTDIGDTGDDVWTDVDGGDASDGSDSNGWGIPIGDCCKQEGDCVEGAFCAPTMKPFTVATGQCISNDVPDGSCWTDGDCPFFEVCIAANLSGCDQGPPTLGTCIPQPEGCCDGSFGGCADGACWFGFCLENFVWGKHCFSDQDCDNLGWICDGAVASPGQCTDGALPPTVGVCKPSGPGGMCTAFTPGLLGECDDVVGWMWIGNACTEVKGCECGDYCDMVFGSENECEQACSPPICCKEDTDCTAGLVCHLGHCAPSPGPGQCFKDEDCADGEICAEASTCTCGSKYCDFTWLPFDSADEPVKPIPCPGGDCPGQESSVYHGACVPPPVCCDPEEAPCDGDQVCVVAGFGTPRCHPIPEPSSCWTASDCGPGEYCSGAQPCDCESYECAPKTGACLPMLEGCCVTTDDCVEGTVCTAKLASEPGGADLGAEVGVCVPPPGPGKCYGDVHCGEGEQCNYWPGFACGNPIDVGPPYPGECTSKDGLCCGTDSQCSDGYACTLTYPISGSICKPAPEPGQCWGAGDCEEDEYCAGAVVCGQCGPCTAESTVGQCADPDGVCCTSDSDCEPGAWCTAVPLQKEWAPDGATLGQCVSPPKDIGSCFRNEHCGPDQVCNGFGGLPCGMLAVTDFGSPTYYPGYCNVADGFCCSEETDCPDGYHCAGGDPLKPKDEGVCKPILNDGTCWTDFDCNGGPCVGAQLCGCAFCGEQFDMPGTCQ
ncbi:MAG: hypothetical protein IV100_11160 [Myxococcales bacterium]|nr:hypothetical protein [Myxococcales bacterium]